MWYEYVVAKPTYEELLEVVSELRRLLAERDHQIAELERAVEELRRSGKRQAAPFSKGEPKDKPKRPGRKPGKKYGNQVGACAPQAGGRDNRGQLPIVL
jgi:hypothetical protein